MFFKYDPDFKHNLLQQHAYIMHELFTPDCIDRLENQIRAINFPKGWQVQLGDDSGELIRPNYILDVIIKLPKDYEFHTDEPCSLLDKDNFKLALPMIDEQANDSLNNLVDLLSQDLFSFDEFNEDIRALESLNYKKEENRVKEIICRYNFKREILYPMARIRVLADTDNMTATTPALINFFSEERFNKRSFVEYRSGIQKRLTICIKWDSVEKIADLYGLETEK